jgi:hypothetical protein
VRDPLLEQLDRLKKQAADTGTRYKRQYDQSSIGRFQQDTSALVIFWYQIVRSVTWVWLNILRPLLRFFIFTPMKWLWGKYRALWDQVVYVKDQYGDRTFSKVRGGLFLTATLYVVYILPNLIELVWDTALYAATAQRHEQVYLISSQEIYPDRDIHAVKGCDALPCNDQNSFYFRVRPTLFNHIWSLLHHATVFFPDYVAAAAPAGITPCRVTNYGIRVKFVMKGLDLYPDALEISCAK